LFKRELGLINPIRVINVSIYEKDLLFDRASMWGFTDVCRLHHGATDGAFGFTFGAFESVGYDVGHSVWATQAEDADFS
jgi:hypothetical protein